MKKNSRFAGFYMGLIFFLMYLPIAVVIVFSFNESKLPVKFTGFSLKWYQELFHDRAMLEALDVYKRQINNSPNAVTSKALFPILYPPCCDGKKHSIRNKILSIVNNINLAQEREFVKQFSLFFCAKMLK